mmetsp:Transcript_9811/g.21856  ORF Transcript_9811/g.21856 Transcript_9811/m.21856 type:complete len:136 (+) Transcript_9811:135-542(+)
MTDSRLRCALVYRLEGINKPPTSTATFGIDDDDVGVRALEMGTVSSAITDAVILAKFDYAKDYELSGGSASTTELYGGRDKGFAEAVQQVILGDPPTMPSLAGGGEANLGACKVVNSEAHKVVYGANGDGLCKVI